MPEPNTQNEADISRVIDLAIELGDLARRVRRELEAAKAKDNGK